MKQSMRTAAFSAGILLLSFSAAFAATPGQTAPSTAQESFVLPTQSAPAPQDPNTVPAVVDGRQIKAADVDGVLKTLDPKQAQSVNTPEGRQNILDDLINRELFYMKAKATKLEEDKSFKEQFEPVAEVIKKNLSRKVIMDKLAAGITVTDEEAKEYYQKNPAKFLVPEMVRVSHILLGSEGDAKRVLDEIKAGFSFEDANTRYSTCPNKANEPGGDIGWHPRGRLYPELEQVAFSMKKGDVGGPVKANNGWNVIKVTDRKDPTTATFEEMKDRIRELLLREKDKKLYDDEVKKLRDEYKSSVSFPKSGEKK